MKQQTKKIKHVSGFVELLRNKRQNKNIHISNNFITVFFFVTWDILTRLWRRRNVTENKTSEIGESRNDSSDVEDHNQSDNPRHQDEPDEERDRST